jgi:hypothetical protein
VEVAVEIDGMRAVMRILMVIDPEHCIEQNVALKKALRVFTNRR